MNGQLLAGHCPVVGNYMWADFLANFWLISVRCEYIMGSIWREVPVLSRHVEDNFYLIVLIITIYRKSYVKKYYVKKKIRYVRKTKIFKKCFRNIIEFQLNLTE